ncbi:hypothetical protein M8J75_006047 [Diaphorina citri]|nr:hypothetical protein M8J75_006047 [Diaphorina citri]KAI5743698.1 hypothetical protein M8J77_021192 [Diaphorina citri]
MYHHRADARQQVRGSSGGPVASERRRSTQRRIRRTWLPDTKPRRSTLSGPSEGAPLSGLSLYQIVNQSSHLKPAITLGEVQLLGDPLSVSFLKASPNLSSDQLGPARTLSF